MRLILALLLACYPAWSAIALVANAGANTAGGGTATTSAIDTTGATLLVVAFGNFGGTSSSLSDSKGNTWIPVTNYVQGSQNIEFFYAKNPTVGAGHTFSGIGSYANVCVSAWSGTETASPLDQINGGGVAASITVQPGSITPGSGNQLVVTAVASNQVGSWTINSSFNLINAVAPSNERVQDAYKIQTSAAAVNPTWTANSSAEQAAAIVSFKAASAGSAPRLLLLGVGE